MLKMQETFQCWKVHGDSESHSSINSMIAKLNGKFLLGLCSKGEKKTGMFPNNAAFLLMPEDGVNQG